jgi:hypothetical protein
MMAKYLNLDNQIQIMIPASYSYDKRFVMTVLVLPLLFVAGVSVLNNNFLQNASAQANSTVDTFSASGYTGQVFVLPGGAPQASESILQFGIAPPQGSILSGNWSFAVSGGQLQDFKWNAEAIALNGKVNGSFSISEIRNSTGAILPGTNNNIQLTGNTTAFRGIADVNINGNTAFHDVPVTLYLINGKLANLSLDAFKTGGYFSVPRFGIVTSLTQ